jgi:transposase-like protein
MSAASSKTDLSAFAGKLLEEQDGGTLREGTWVLSQALMESEVSGLIGAERHERSWYRHGYRLRSWDTRVRTIELAAVPGAFHAEPGGHHPTLGS